MDQAVERKDVIERVLSLVQRLSEQALPSGDAPPL